MELKIQNSKFIIQGRVVHGEHYGKKLGFPTANLDRRDYVRRKLKIRLGVWAGYAIIRKKTTSPRPSPQEGRGRRWKAAIVIGPIDKRGLPKIEAHLLNFKGNLYGKQMVIGLYKYLRLFRKFKNEGELKRQIKKDIALVKKS